MADSSSSVLREYLVALGFKVNEADAKKFDAGLEKWDKRATKLGKSLFGVGVAAQAMVTQFAFSMEKLYYSSKRTESAVGNIQALDYGFRRVGGASGQFQQSLEAMTRNLRSNPGLTGLLNSLGVKVTGRDKSDVLVDLVQQLNKMPPYIAERYANLFGIDPDTLFMLRQGIDEMKKAAEWRKNLAAEMGVDTEEAAKAGKEYANSWREILEYVGLFRDALAIQLLPLMQELSNVTKEVLKDWVQIIKQPDAMTRFLEGVGLKPVGGGVELSKESKARLGQAETEGDTYEGTNLGTGEKVVFRKKWLDRQFDKLLKWGGAKKGQAPLADQASVDAAQDLSPFKTGGMGDNYASTGQSGGYRYVGPRSSMADSANAAVLFARLEAKYALPPGTLNRLWQTESGGGKNLTGPMTKYGTAKGHFQFIDSTAKQYGLDVDGGRADRDDLNKSAEAAARYYSDLMRQSNGNAREAAARYNWGPGNVDRYGLGAAPAETRAYMDKVAPAGAQINQTNHITVSGSSDPRKAGEQVREELRTSNADLVRNMKARVE